MVFFLYSSLFWELRDKRTLKKFIFDPKAAEPCQNIDIFERGQTHSHVCVRHLFFSQVFFFSLSPCLYHELFYGHAIFIGNSQKDARYLSFPVLSLSGLPLASFKITADILIAFAGEFFTEEIEDTESL